MINIFLFFFFKQKTAYEMRISDWSSDVCSSDLRRSRAGARPAGCAGACRHIQQHWRFTVADDASRLHHPCGAERGGADGDGRDRRDAAPVGGAGGRGRRDRGFRPGLEGRRALKALFPHAATTRGVTVRVVVSYLADQSEPADGRWFWAYH